MQNQMLQKALAAEDDIAVYNQLKQFLEEKPEIPQICTRTMIDQLSILARKSLQCSPPSAPDIERLMLLLQAVMHVAGDEEDQCSEGLMLWLQHGLIDMVSDIFITALHCVRKSNDENGRKLYVEVLDTIGAISDFSVKAKEKMVEIYGGQLLQVVIAPSFIFVTRLEALKTLNVVMEKCPVQIREKFKGVPGHMENIQKLGRLIHEAGDYEFQVGIIETLFRLTHKPQRESFSKSWFQNEKLHKSFLAIKDTEFETDCRILLNSVNDPTTNQCTSVISLPCQTVSLGKLPLRKPEDAKYSDFWVDFNTVSHRITLFCEPDQTDDEEESLWETVAIWDDNIQSLSIKGTLCFIQYLLS